MTITLLTGSPRYLEMLATTALSADDIKRTEDDLWGDFHTSWNQLEASSYDHPGPLGAIAINGMALLRLLTGTPVPHLAAQAATIHIDKNAGYAGIGNTDPWANFRLSTKFGISAYKSALVRLSDKYIRMANLRANAANNRVNESLTDTLADTIAYSLIAICLWEEARLDGGFA